MSLKSLIQWLLDSRTTPEEAGHSAMPSASETVLLTQNDAFQSWGNIHQGVAADDGYVNIFARSVNNTTSEMRVLTSGMTFSSAQTEAEKDMACSAPVAKGQTYTIKGIQVKGIKIIFVKTLGAIGGGYNRFVWRALLCLKPSSNFLPRSFCKANPNGSAIKLCQTIQPSGLFTHLKAHPVNTSHRLTGMSLFTPVAMNGRKSGMETEVSSSPQRVLPTSAFKCLSLKAPKLGMSFRTPWPTELKKRPLSLFQQSERDALTGGSLC